LFFDKHQQRHPANCELLILVTYFPGFGASLSQHTDYDNSIEGVSSLECVENFMKLPLISASVVAYTLLAAAWLCYVGDATISGAPF
jgi:hypothetical protein